MVYVLSWYHQCVECYFFYWCAVIVNPTIGVPDCNHSMLEYRSQLVDLAKALYARYGHVMLPHQAPTATVTPAVATTTTETPPTAATHVHATPAAAERPILN
jgi:hypothetical protein